MCQGRPGASSYKGFEVSNGSNSYLGLYTGSYTSNTIATLSANAYGKLFSSTNTTLAIPGPANVSGERLRLYDFNDPSKCKGTIDEIDQAFVATRNAIKTYCEQLANRILNT